MAHGDRDVAALRHHPFKAHPFDAGGELGPPTCDMQAILDDALGRLDQVPKNCIAFDPRQGTQILAVPMQNVESNESE